MNSTLHKYKHALKNLQAKYKLRIRLPKRSPEYDENVFTLTYGTLFLSSCTARFVFETKKTCEESLIKIVSKFDE